MDWNTTKILEHSLVCCCKLNNTSVIQQVELFNK